MDKKKLFFMTMTLLFVVINLFSNFFITNAFASETSSDVTKYKVDEIVRVTSRTDVDTLYENDQATLNIIIENISTQPITPTKISLTGPSYSDYLDSNSDYLDSNSDYLDSNSDYLHGELTSEGVLDKEIEPGHSIIITYNLTTEDKVTPSKSKPIFFNIQFKQNNISFNKIQTIDLNIQVSVEEIFSKVGLTSLSLLPGVIFIVFFIFFLKRKEVNWVKNLKFDDSIVVVSGILISLIVNWFLTTIYLCLNFIPSGNDSYGTSDILRICVVSVVVSQVIAYLYYKWIEKVNEDRIFSTDDDAMRVITKVSKNQPLLNLEVFKMAANPKETEGNFLLLLPENSTKDSIKFPDERRFICPNIKITIKKSDKVLDDKIIKIIREEQNSKNLVKFLKKNRANFEIEWSNGTDGASSEVIERPVGANSDKVKQNLIDY